MTQEKALTLSIREKFEDTIFLRRFIGSLIPTDVVEMNTTGIHLVPGECPTKEEFLRRQENGFYVDPMVDIAWWAWQEALSAAQEEIRRLGEERDAAVEQERERCAQIAESTIDVPNPGSPPTRMWRHFAHEQIAAAIRAPVAKQNAPENH